MHSDFWTSRLAAAKRQFSLLQHLQSSHLGIDDFEVDEEVRHQFPCPYCYDDFDVSSLCSHLEDEHSSESKVTVCPICAVKISRDMSRHITLHHGHLLKLQRRRRLRKVAIPNGETLSLLSRDLREAHLQVLMGGDSGGYRSNNSNISTPPAADPLVSSLILNYPASELEEISKSVLNHAEDTSVKNEPWKTSFDPVLSREEREKRTRRAVGRAGFMQDLVLTTLLGD